MAKANTTKMDKQVQDLFKIVQQKKAEIAKAEKPNWLTNCSFSYDENGGSSRLNLQVITDINRLVAILAFLNTAETAYHVAATILGVKTEFKWLGFTREEWQTDIQTRINKIQISKKKLELETLEGRLNALISPELKQQLELAEISKMLESSK